MTKRELSQLYYLGKEIDQLQARIAELEAAASSGVSCITGLPGGSGRNDKVSRYASELADLRGILDANIRKSFYLLNRISNYIASIDDAEVRLIMTLRHINKMSWSQVAESVSIYATEDSVRKTHDRFLSKK